MNDWLTLHNLSQVGVLIFSSVAIWLINEPDSKPKRRWIGAIMGLLSQPFWFLAAWEAQQWGAGLLSVWYTLSWCKGVRNNWRSHKQQQYLREIRASVKLHRVTPNLIKDEDLCHQSSISPISSNASIESVRPNYQ